MGVTAQRSTIGLTEVFANRFKAVVDEMAWIVHRSSHTTFVKETQDFGTGLVTPAGEMFSVVDSTGVIALVGIPMRPIVDAIRDWSPGDVVITNDPYSTRGMVMHLSDMYLFRPVFVDGKLICLTWAFVHCSDVGGSVPGSIDGRNYEIFQEGLRLRPVKLFEAGRLNQAVADVITDNCRIPTLNWGDLSALLAALEVGESRVARIAERYGVDIVCDAMDAVLDQSESVARSVLKTIPSGSYKFTEYFEDDYVNDVPVRLQLELTSTGDGRVQLDFTGTDPQVAASLNLPAGGQLHHPFHSLALVELIMTRTEGVHVNAGLLRPINLVLPEASIVNSSFPAACGMRVLTNCRIHEMVLGALTKAIPGEVPASGASQLAVTSISVVEPTGRGRVVVANPVQGGSGGGNGLDGISGSDIPSAALRNVPVEVLEAEAPVLVHRFALRTDSEGAGEFRGGFGIEYAFELTEPGAVIVTRGKDRQKFVAWGANGGGAGTAGYARATKPERAASLDLGKSAMYRPEVGEVIEIAGGGGGGYGNPLRRDAAAVLSDVRDGLLTRDRARNIYGVAIDGAVIDEVQTRTLRGHQLHAHTGFDYGPARTAWEEKYSAAADAIAGWLLTFPPQVRRTVQVRAYQALASTSDRALTDQTIRTVLDTISHDVRQHREP